MLLSIRRFIKMDNMHVFGFVLNCINKYDPEIRKRKVSNEQALKDIEKVLRSGTSWRHLTPKVGTFSCIHKRFTKWTNKGIFDKAWTELLKLYSVERLSENSKWFKDLYIDSTMVKNIGGTDCVGKNPTDRGRLGTKTSIICDDNLVPLSCTHYGANVADINTLLGSFDEIKCQIKIDHRCTVNLIGDKGYVSEPHK